MSLLRTTQLLRPRAAPRIPQVAQQQRRAASSGPSSMSGSSLSLGLFGVIGGTLLVGAVMNAGGKDAAFKKTLDGVVEQHGPELLEAARKELAEARDALEKKTRDVRDEEKRAVGVLEEKVKTLSGRHGS